MKNKQEILDLIDKLESEIMRGISSLMKLQIEARNQIYRDAIAAPSEESAASVTETPVPAAPSPQQDEKPEPDLGLHDKKTATLDDCIDAAKQLRDSKGVAAVVAVFKKHGLANIQQLQPKDFEAFLESCVKALS